MGTRSLTFPKKLTTKGTTHDAEGNELALVPVAQVAQVNALLVRLSREKQRQAELHRREMAAVAKDLKLASEGKLKLIPLRKFLQEINEPGRQA